MGKDKTPSSGLILQRTPEQAKQPSTKSSQHKVNEPGTSSLRQHPIRNLEILSFIHKRFYEIASRKPGVRRLYSSKYVK